MHISNGIIAEITEQMGEAFFTVEYGRGEVVRLLVDEGTTILNRNCEEMMWSDLKEGDRIDARISDAMARSMPPQAVAYMIRLLSEEMSEEYDFQSEESVMTAAPAGPGMPPGPGRPPRPDLPPGPGMPPGQGRPPRPPVEEVTIGRIWNIDRNNRRFDTITGQDFSSLTRFNVPENTRILNRQGRTMNFSGLMIGMRVQVRHANFMTPSIPPQTTAFEVRVL